MASESSERHSVGCPALKARTVLDDAVKVLKASPAIDHWQRGRERIEAEDLLWHVLGEEPDPRDDITDRAAADVRSTGRVAAPPVSPSRSSRDTRSSEAWICWCVRGSSSPGTHPSSSPSRRCGACAAGRGRSISTWRPERGRSRWRWRTRSPGGRGRDRPVRGRRQARSREREAAGAASPVLHRRPVRRPPADAAGTVDVITLHPPYVPMRELKDLPEEIRDWEPEHTLTDRSPDGLGLISRTAREAPAWLSPNGWLLLEVSSDRVQHVKGRAPRRGVPRHPQHEGWSAAADEGDRGRDDRVTGAAPYGTWRSPISAEMVSAGDDLPAAAAPRTTASSYWLEGRPAEGGRSVLVRADAVLRAGGRHAAGVQRPHDRARVRRRRLPAP